MYDAIYGSNALNIYYSTRISTETDIIKVEMVLKLDKFIALYYKIMILVLKCKL